ncbi:hypothetical protein VP01_2905g4 [Puccinia sorghi]|uniref:Uncharacterized protein n=1 Tax=Puccinia sorghi TaxID=27349 RepID=A0A0L6V1D1_9BASI|nr:hypothetical protein VP01_2905g4 [Puccinia sorghi]
MGTKRVILKLPPFQSFLYFAHHYHWSGASISDSPSRDIAISFRNYQNMRLLFSGAALYDSKTQAHFQASPAMTDSPYLMGPTHQRIYKECTQIIKFVRIHPSISIIRKKSPKDHFS